MFFSDNYQEYKKEVITLFNQYVIDRQKFQETLKQQDENSDDDVESWKETIKRLERGKYSLVVLGEASSGKSSFINGLLGKPILPTNITQCTSTIIDIVDIGNEQDNKTVDLKIEFADGKQGEPEEYNIQEIEVFQERLNGLVSIPEKYKNIAKDISFIKMKEYHTIDSSDINKRQEYVQSLVKNLKDYKKLNEEEIESNIKGYKAYLERYGDLSEIPQKITIGYPLGFEFQEELHILDTPGINAEGNLENLTLDLINGNDPERQLNAIIFLNKINNNVNSKTFAELVRNTKLKDTFLFLTDKTSCNKKQDVEEALESVKDSFKKYIDPERIIAVDSILKLAWEELGKNPEKDTFIELCDKDPEHEKWWNLLSPYFKYRGLIGIDDEEAQNIADKIYTDSNYQEVERLLQEFFSAKDEELNEIVGIVLGGYKQQEKDCELQIKLLDEEVGKLAGKIDKIKNDLVDYTLKFNEFSRKQGNKYSGLESENLDQWSLLKTNYLSLLEKTDDEFSVKNCLLDFSDDANKQFDDIIQKLKNDYTEEMKAIGEEFDETYRVSPPVISLKAISEKAKKEAIESIVIPGNKLETSLQGVAKGFAAGALGGIWGGPPGVAIEGIVGAAIGGISGYFEGKPEKVVEQLNDEKYYESLNKQVRAAMILSCEDMQVKISNLFYKYDINFTEKLKKVILEREQSLDDLLKQKEEHKPLFQRRKDIEDILQSVKPRIKVCEDLNPATASG